MTYIAPTDRPYEPRQVVARMGRAGEFDWMGGRYIIWKYLTFYVGKNQPAVCAEFEGLAPTDKEGFVNLDALRDGAILVDPGLVYRKIPMTGRMMAEHLRRMKKFRPKEIIQYEKDTTAPAINIGSIDMRGVTKQ